MMLLVQNLDRWDRRLFEALIERRHATAGLAAALPMVLGCPLVFGGPILALGVLIGASRAYLGIHYPGDVLAGWGIAGAVTLVAALLTRQVRPAESPAQLRER